MSLQYGLRKLVCRWKDKLKDKIDFSSISSRSSTSSYTADEAIHKSVQSKKQIPTISTIKRDTFNFIREQNTTEEIHKLDSSTKYIRNYCGSLDQNKFYNGNDIKNPNHDSHSDDLIKTNSTEKSVSNTNSSIKFIQMLEKLSEVPISFYNDATCFAIGEAIHFQNKSCQRMLGLTLGTNFGSAFIDQLEIIKNRSDVPSGGILSNYPYDDNSMVDDWFSTRGLINIYNTIKQEELFKNGSDLITDKRNKLFYIENKVELFSK